MKKRKRDSTGLALWILIFTMLAIISAIIFLNIRMQSLSDMKSLLLNLLNSLLSAVTVGLIATTFTKIVANNMAKVKRNNEKLNEFGVEYIGTGRSTKKDTVRLFGNKYTGEYPDEIKLLFISGNGYFSRFNKEMLQCVQNSNCIVKILLLSTSAENNEYISRMEYMCPQKTSYSDQVNKESLPILQSVVDNLEQNKKDHIQVRFYKDEYRYNFRISKYCSDESVYGKCWLNIQPFNRDAVDVSIGLNGSWGNDNYTDSNIFELLDIGFDQLWDKYKESTYKFKK